MDYMAQFDEAVAQRIDKNKQVNRWRDRRVTVRT